MDKDQAVPYMVVIEKPSMHTTVQEALVKGIIGGLCVLMTQLTLRAVKKSDEKKDEAKKKLAAESKPSPTNK